MKTETAENQKHPFIRQRLELKNTPFSCSGKKASLSPRLSPLRSLQPWLFQSPFFLFRPISHLFARFSHWLRICLPVLLCFWLSLFPEMGIGSSTNGETKRSYQRPELYYVLSRCSFLFFFFFLFFFCSFPFHHSSLVSPGPTVFERFFFLTILVLVSHPSTFSSPTTFSTLLPCPAL